MNWGFILNMAVSAFVLAASVGAFYVAWRAAVEHDRNVRRAAKLDRDLKLSALRQVGINRHQPFDIHV